MKTRIMLLAIATSLSGCAVDMHHPTKSLAEQKLDRQSCETKPGQVVDCLKARGFVAIEYKAFPFDDVE